jgi:hypothetical protein
VLCAASMHASTVSLHFFMQSGSSFLTSAAEAAPTVTADRKIALSAMDFKAIITISSRGVVGTRPNVSTIDRLALTVHAYDHEVLAARAVCAVTETIRRRAEKEGA